MEAAMFERARLWHRALMAVAMFALTSSIASAQNASPFLFTVTTPVDVAGSDAQVDAAVAEPGLTQWISGTFDPGVSAGVVLGSDLIVRSTRGTVDFISGGQRFASFQQIEVVRPIGHSSRRDVAVGGGVREEWGGGRVFIGRVIAGLTLAGGRLEGNAVVERATTPGRDPVDMITTIGWSHAVTDRFGVGVEAVGQDLEGFWSRDEADGGARLLVGPSLHVAPGNGRSSLTVPGGPLVRSISTAPASDAPREIPTASLQGHYAVLGSFTYTLSPHP
jgi:hypothetical protein